MTVSVFLRKTEDALYQNSLLAPTYSNNRKQKPSGGIANIFKGQLHCNFSAKFYRNKFFML